MLQYVAEQTTDPELWALVKGGRAEAFEELVRRYQSLVCAVAYNSCGDKALSEDVSQETFWTAWRERASEVDPNRIRGWLCGIARNLARNANRRASRPADVASPLDESTTPANQVDDPSTVASSREEEALVWNTLEKIPDPYREAIILFYREDQSVAEVAAALEISEEAARQRLSRGRAMIREQLTGVIERELRSGRPGRTFTVAVMSGIAASATGSKAAMAAGVAGGTAKAAGMGVGSGLLGGLAGATVGIGGSWLGTWIPTQLVSTMPEREVYRRHGRQVMFISLLFTLGVLGFTLGIGYFNRTLAMVSLFVGIAAFQIYIFTTSFRLARELKRVRLEAGPDAEPNVTALRTGTTHFASRLRGRRYRSQISFLGLPLIDFNVSDPQFAPSPSPQCITSRTARGWVAVGDDARGILLGVATRNAIGFVAVGGRALGIISAGGFAVGLISLGGFAAGLISFGGFSLGLLTVGGFAMGYQAFGGGAIAWDTAFGGGAIALHRAFGGAAIARDYAVGGGGYATHFNDIAAKAESLSHPFKVGLDLYLAHQTLSMFLFFVGVALFVGTTQLIMYRRVPKD